MTLCLSLYLSLGERDRGLLTANRRSIACNLPYSGNCIFQFFSLYRLIYIACSLLHRARITWLFATQPVWYNHFTPSSWTIKNLIFLSIFLIYCRSLLNFFSSSPQKIRAISYGNNKKCTHHVFVYESSNMEFWNFSTVCKDLWCTCFSIVNTTNIAIMYEKWWSSNNFQCSSLINIL